MRDEHNVSYRNDTPNYFLVKMGVVGAINNKFVQCTRKVLLQHMGEFYKRNIILGYTPDQITFEYEVCQAELWS